MTWPVDDHLFQTYDSGLHQSQNDTTCVCACAWLIY